LQLTALVFFDAWYLLSWTTISYIPGNLLIFSQDIVQGVHFASNDIRKKHCRQLIYSCCQLFEFSCLFLVEHLFCIHYLFPIRWKSFRNWFV